MTRAILALAAVVGLALLLRRWDDGRSRVFTDPEEGLDWLLPGWRDLERVDSV